MMQRYIGLSGVAAAAVLSTGLAWADPGEEGQLAFGAERLFGVVYSSQTVTDENDVESARSATNFTLLNNPGIDEQVLNWPRLGIDYFAIDGLSVGGVVGLTSLSVTDEDPAGGPDSEASALGFLFGPRVGYYHPFSQMVSIWPRAGITYTNVSVEDDDGGSSFTVSLTSLSLDVPLSITPSSGWGFLVGPTFDMTLTGTQEFEVDLSPLPTQTVESDFEVFEIGVQAGLWVYLE